MSLDLRNLLDETEKVLHKHGKELSDILWVGGKDFEIDLRNFLDVAAQTYYDPGYGAQEIATDLMIIGADFWMVRREYDGSEWWSYLTMPKAPSHEVKHISSLRATQDQIGWRTLAKINEEEL